ncbi:MAG: redoxin domain-containing protein [Planctomycetaceae bacterium]
MRGLKSILAVLLVVIGSSSAIASESDAENQYWLLLHEPAAIAELKLSPSQQASFQSFLDELDLRYFPLRNKPTEVAIAGISKLAAEARAQLKTLLEPPQQKRLNELRLQQLGNRALLQEEVIQKLGYTESQKQKIREINEATQAGVAALQKEATDGKPRKLLEQKHAKLQTDQQKKIVAILKPEQIANLKSLYGAPFELSRLGRLKFKPPEFVDTGEWVNSEPRKLAELQGKVVVVHFYAFGCINCIHNYPWYRKWSDDFEGKDVVIVGIHTPETEKERSSESVRQKADEEKLKFPILIDGKNENWNAWGNSMWPTVYVIDRQGYLRAYWQGELKWQGSDGEKYLRERIETYLADRKP